MRSDPGWLFTKLHTDSVTILASAGSECCSNPKVARFSNPSRFLIENLSQIIKVAAIAPSWELATARRQQAVDNSINLEEGSLALQIMRDVCTYM